MKHESSSSFTPFAHIGLLLMRLFAGLSMMFAGLDKVPLPSWMVDQVTEIGWMPFPEIMAYLACSAEFVGGLLIAIGLFTRPAALVLAFTMAVAAFAAQGVAPFTEIHVTQGYLWMYVLLLATGPGRFSLDEVLGKRANLIGLLVTVGLTAYVFSQGKAVEEETSKNDDVSIESVAVPSSANGWDPTQDVMSAQAERTYVLIKRLEQGLFEFKLAANGTWDLNMGAVEQSSTRFPLHITGTIDSGGNTDNIRLYAPKSMDYRFELDLQEMTLTVDSVSRSAN